jgi:hypothetical protein
MSSVDKCATLVRQVMYDSRGVVQMSCGLRTGLRQIRTTVAR